MEGEFRKKTTEKLLNSVKSTYKGERGGVTRFGSVMEKGRGKQVCQKPLGRLNTSGHRGTKTGHGSLKKLAGSPLVLVVKRSSRVQHKAGGRGKQQKKGQKRTRMRAKRTAGDAFIGNGK